MIQDLGYKKCRTKENNNYSWSVCCAPVNIAHDSISILLTRHKTSSLCLSDYQNHRSSVPKSPPGKPDPSWMGCKGLGLPICKNLHLSLLNFIKFILMHSSSVCLVPATLRSLLLSMLTVTSSRSLPRLFSLPDKSPDKNVFLMHLQLLFVRSSKKTQNLHKWKDGLGCFFAPNSVNCNWQETVLSKRPNFSTPTVHNC